MLKRGDGGEGGKLFKKIFDFETNLKRFYSHLR